MTAIRDIMTPNIETIQSSENLIEAASKMRALNIGSLPVMRDRAIVGILTDRDIVVRCVAAGLNPAQTEVWDAMTHDIYSAQAHADITEAAGMMERYQVRRLLVVDDHGNPAGFLSVGDIATKLPNEHLKAEILEEVSAHK